jgi:hypothetical protein
VPLDGEPETLEELRHRFRRLVAIARGIVRGNLHDISQELRLGVLMRADEGVDGVFDRHGVPFQISKPSKRMPS